MADSAAVRQRRYRLHKAGDHSLCVLGRCPDVTPIVTRNMASDQGEPDCAGLGEPGRNLWSKVTGEMELGSLQMVLLLEACRTVDRLEQLDRQLRGEGRWLHLEGDEDQPNHFTLVVDRALAEVRQQATALRGLVGEIRQAGKSAKAPAGKKGAGLADITARIAARRAASTS
jgi:hypothetical protein